jgi:hypothetical protein
MLELYYTKITKVILRLNQIEQRYFVLTVATIKDQILTNLFTYCHCGRI